MCEIYVEFHNPPNVTHTCKRKRENLTHTMNLAYLGCFQCRKYLGTLQMFHHQNDDYVQCLLHGSSQPMITQSKMFFIISVLQLCNLPSTTPPKSSSSLKDCGKTKI